MTAPLSPVALAAIEQAISEHRERPGALLPMLHGIQDALGYVPAQAVPAVAEALNLSRAEVHGVISYYHHFRAEAPGRHVVQVCRAEACQARGGEGLWAHACESAGVDKGHGGTSADGALTVLPVYCLGLCAMSPAVAVDEKVHARISQARYDRLVQNLNPLEA